MPIHWVRTPIPTDVRRSHRRMRLSRWRDLVRRRVGRLGGDVAQRYPESRLALAEMRTAPALPLDVFRLYRVGHRVARLAPRPVPQHAWLAFGVFLLGTFLVSASASAREARGWPNLAVVGMAVAAASIAFMPTTRAVRHMILPVAFLGAFLFQGVFHETTRSLTGAGDLQPMPAPVAAVVTPTVAGTAIPQVSSACAQVAAFEADFLPIVDEARGLYREYTASKATAGRDLWQLWHDSWEDLAADLRPLEPPAAYAGSVDNLRMVAVGFYVTIDIKLTGNPMAADLMLAYLPGDFTAFESALSRVSTGC